MLLTLLYSFDMFTALFSRFLPPFNVKIPAAEKKEKAALPTVVSSSQLPFHFLKCTPHLIASQLLVFCSLTNAGSKKCRSQAALLLFYIFRRHGHAGLCHLFAESSVGQASPPHTAVYVPQRQTHTRVSGEKLSTSVLTRLWTHRFYLRLNNCHRLLFSLQPKAPECSCVCPSVQHKDELFVVAFKFCKVIIWVWIMERGGSFAVDLYFSINKNTSKSETVNHYENNFDRWTFKGDIKTFELWVEGC